MGRRITSTATCSRKALEERPLVDGWLLGPGRLGYSWADRLGLRSPHADWTSPVFFLAATFRTIFREAGLKGFYRGLGPTIIGYVRPVFLQPALRCARLMQRALRRYLPTWSIFFSVYDVVKQELGERSLAASSSGGYSGTSAQTSQLSRLLTLAFVPSFHSVPTDSNWAHILAAMTAGATGTIVTNPLWVIKTRFMAQSMSDHATGKRYRNTWDAIRTIYQQEGFRAFYRGLMPSLLGVSHVAVQFPLYEQLKIWSSSFLLCFTFSSASLPTDLS